MPARRTRYAPSDPECDVAQGFVIAQATPADAVAEWVMTWIPFPGWKGRTRLA
jgi:hypothetical protein